MLKETNKALELLSTMNCENLELVKKELRKIVGDEIIEEKEVINIIGINSITISDMSSELINCLNNCKNLATSESRNNCIRKCNIQYL